MNSNFTAIDRIPANMTGPFVPETGAAGALVHVACPECGRRLDRVSDDTLICTPDQHTFQCVEGIWRLMPDERISEYQAFIHDYETVRSAENRGADDAVYYLQLPFTDATGRFSDDWRIRATSFRALIDRVVRPMEERHGRPLTILDVGAGNGWLSNRLAARGHDVAAIDLLTNRQDGLGAYVHYDTRFLPVQAEFDNLPFADERADLVVFNGSLHYSTDYTVTLTEAMRVLRPNGQIAIVDSPVYRRAASGRQMVREREAEFEHRYGFRSDAIPSENFLTFDRLNVLALSLKLRWQVIEPDYGLAWRLRPWRARIRRRREPARFMLLVGGRRNGTIDARQSTRRAIARRALRYRYALTQRHRHDSLVIEHVAGKPILVMPQVFNPALLRSGAFLAETLLVHPIPDGAKVLDMGTGSGVGAVFAASRASRVVAVDVNPAAVRCAGINALLNDVHDRITVLEGDLFAPLGTQRFDVVLFNPPYFRGAPVDAMDHAWRSIDVVERFADGLADHLNPNGYALVVLSTDGDSEAFLNSFRANELTVETIQRKDMVNEVLTVYRLSTKGAHADVDSL